MRVIVQSTRCILNDFFKVDEAFVQYEKFDGKMSKVMRRLNFDRGDAVGALILLRDSAEFIFVNQFRFPIYTKNEPAWIDEIVAGIVEDESHEDCIRREIREEAGYEVESLSKMFHIYPTPGGSSERIYLYHAVSSSKNKVSSGGGEATEGENILVRHVPVEETKKLLRQGHFKDAKTMIALYQYFDMGF